MNRKSDAPAPRLRPATNGDAAAVRNLVFQVLAEYGLRPDPAGADADLLDLEAHYEGAGGWFRVLVDPAGRVIGSVGLSPVGEGVVELRKMYLDPGFRGRGWGRLLLASALEEARRRGCHQVTLETASVLKEAMALYDRHGFRRRPGAPHVCRCDLVMELDLAEPPPPAPGPP